MSEKNINEKRFPDWKPPTFDEKGMTEWNWMVTCPENLILGKFTDIGAFTYIDAKYGVTIGDFVQIGSHTSIYSGDSIDDKKGEILIRDNVKIGSHCVIMPGIWIGRNSKIGALSFVNHRIPENVVARGRPCRVVRRLRPEELSH